MKRYYLLISILSLIFTGCSINYTIKDYPTKEKFNEIVNNSIKNKDINVVLTTDSSFSVCNGSTLFNDTLYSLRKSKEKKHLRFNNADIDRIKYSSNDYKSARISLKNGEVFSGENIRTNKDSIKFDIIETKEIKEIIVPVDKIKTISYQNHWSRVPLGALTGMAIGLASGIWYASGLKSKDDAGKGSGAGVGGALIGGVIGSFISYFIGCNYIFHFNL